MKALCAVVAMAILLAASCATAQDQEAVPELPTIEQLKAQVTQIDGQLQQAQQQINTLTATKIKILGAIEYAEALEAQKTATTKKEEK